MLRLAFVPVEIQENPGVCSANIASILSSYLHFKDLPYALAPSKLPGWAGVIAGSVSLFEEIALAAQLGIGALKVPVSFGDPSPSDKKYRYLQGFRSK